MDSDMQWALSHEALLQGGETGLLAWFAQLPDDTTRARFFETIARRLHEVDPEKRRAWLESQARQPYRDDNVYRLLIGDLATTDPEGAFAFAMALPPSPKNGGRPGLGAATFRWLDQDPAAFAAYFRTLAPGELRSGIVSAIENSLRDPKLPERLRTAATQFYDGLR